MSKRKRIVPNVIRGGVAIPLGANYFLMNGNTHEQGGIDIGKDLEVENGEIIKTNPKSIKVLSNAPIMNGITPAQLALGGLKDGTFENRFNEGFKYQERFKDINGLKDDGTKALYGRKKKDIGGEDKNITYDDKIIKLEELKQKYLNSQGDDRQNYYNSYRELIKQIGKETLEKYKGTNKDPMLYPNWAKSNEEAEKYLIDSGIRVDKSINDDAKEFLKSYVNSEGFQRIRSNQLNWWKQRHPYQKYLYFMTSDKRQINDYVNSVNKNIDDTTTFTLNGYPELSFRPFALDKSTIVYKPFAEDKKHPNHETTMHELDHIFNHPASSYTTINAEVMDQNKGNKVNGHDELYIEKHSDNLGVKYLLFKEGIYDARGNKDITPEQIQQLREKYPKIRFLQQLNNEEAAFQINNVAKLDNNKDNREKAFLGIFKKKDNKDNNNDSTKNDGKSFLKALRDRTQHLFNNSIVGESLERIRENDSPTKTDTEKLEDNIAHRHEQFLKVAKRKGIESDEYYIPYIPEKEIIIKGAGRASSNMLDSIAVNSVKAKIPFKEALGLAVEETKMGAIPNISTDAWIDNFEKTNSRKPTSKEIANYERIALNSSFARNYGGIYPQFLINNHEWWQRGWEESSKYANILGNIESPLQHGFTLYKLGLYNTGDKNHKSKVISAGNKAIASKDVQEWLKTSKYAKNIIKKLGGKVEMNRNKRNVPSTGKKIKAKWGIKIDNPKTLEAKNYGLDIVEPGLAPISGYHKKADGSFIPINQTPASPNVSFLEANPNFLGNAITAGANVIGSTISYFANRKMLKDLKEPIRPEALQAIKLKTNINIKPQLNQLRRTIDKYNRFVDRNTASSQVAAGRLLNNELSYVDGYNQLYGSKENQETQLINQDRLNSQEVAKYNLENYNNWRDNVRTFKNTVREKQSENTNDYIQNLAGTFGNFLNNNAQWRNSMMNIAALSAAYPDVTPELMYSKGIPYSLWLKQRNAKRATNK